MIKLQEIELVFRHMDRWMDAQTDMDVEIVIDMDFNLESKDELYTAFLVDRKSSHL